MGRKRNDLTRMRYGKLTVVRLLPNKASDGHALYECACDCGNHLVVSSGKIKQRKGCNDCTKRKYGGDTTTNSYRLYRIWGNMKHKCVASATKFSKGATNRLITLCDEWKDFNSFREWAYENGYSDEADSKNCMLYRKELEKGFSPDNCVWAGEEYRRNNKRMCLSVNDLTGKRFGMLVVVGRCQDSTTNHDTMWTCKCDCGNEKVVTAGHLTCGTVKSCGCLRREVATQRIKQASLNNVKHGAAGSSLYGVWNCMKQRCDNPKNPNYKYYGGKGVRLCKEWYSFENFAEWAFCNGYYEQENVSRPQKLSIDRIDSDGNYCPENCRWITVHENTLRATTARWAKEMRGKKECAT